VSFGTRCASFVVSICYPALTLALQERFLMDNEIVEHVVVRPDNEDRKRRC